MLIAKVKGHELASDAPTEADRRRLKALIPKLKGRRPAHSSDVNVNVDEIWVPCSDSDFVERHDTQTPGWFHHGAQILAVLERHRPKVCVELGSWLGASAIPVALSIRRWGGTLTCVDTWSGDVYRASDEPKPPLMLMSCARNVVAAGVSGNVRFVASTTLDAAAWWTEPIDYLYVDADHTYESVLADLGAWLPHVRPGGVIAGDDYGNPSFPGVQVAWDEFEAVHGLRLTRFQSTPPHRDGVQLIYGRV